MIDEQPVKKRIDALRGSLEMLHQQNAECKKSLINIDKELKILENRLHDPFSVVKDYFELSRQTMTAQHEKECVLFEEQTKFLQQQIHDIIEDRVKATQQELILEEKIRNLMQDLG